MAESSAPKRRIRYYLDPKIGIHSSPEASLLKPHVIRLTDELVKAYGLQEHMTLCEAGSDALPLLSPDEACRFHTDAYVRFLQQIATHGADIADDAASYAINNSVCFSETAWEYAQVYAGASVEAANCLASGVSDIGINWIGGQTHARRDGAAGFSYVNDAVLAILAMLRVQERVMFVNVDAWHCSGVEEAFYTTDRVLSVSLHRHAEGFFPGSGDGKDTGAGGGVHHSINLPVAEGLTDDELEALFAPVVAAAAERFQPACIVYCAGAGILSGDRLGCMNASIAGFGRCLQAVIDLGRPLLVLGAGGFNQTNTARAWCHATGMLCAEKLADELPAHDYVDYYLPHSTLDVPAVNMTNKNTAESLKATLEAGLATAGQIPQRPPAPKLTPKPAAATEGAATATGEAAAASAGAVGTNGKSLAVELASPGLTANEALLASPPSQPLPATADVPMDASSALEPAAAAKAAASAAAADPAAPTATAAGEAAAAAPEPAAGDAMDVDAAGGAQPPP